MAIRTENVLSQVQHRNLVFLVGGMVESGSHILSEHVELKFDTTHIVSLSLQDRLDELQTTAEYVLLL